MEEDDDEGYIIENIIPAPVCACHEPGISYVCMRRDPDRGFPSVNYTCNLKFILKDVVDGIGEFKMKE